MKSGSSGPCLRLASRRSPLAVAQTRSIARLLRQAWPGLRVVIVLTEAAADRDMSTPLAQMGGQGVFATEVQALVINREADVGVHSCKDLPTTLPPATLLAAVPRRADPRDCLIGAASLSELPLSAVVGTSSPRRLRQLAALRPDLRFVNLRGNVGTRLGKVAAGDMDGTIMAMAGLRRLGLRMGAPLDPWSVLVPAPGQGALALEIRRDDARTRALVARLDDRDSHAAIRCERAILAGIGGGCSLPLGAFAQRQANGQWRLRVALFQDPGWFHADVSGPLAGLAERVLTDWRNQRVSHSSPPHPTTLYP